MNAPSTIEVTILVDNQAAPGLAAEHGFAAWIDLPDRRLLFDAGQGPALATNAAMLSIDLRAADALIVSHGHYDHTGGIPRIVELAPAVQVYVHPDAMRSRYSIRDGAAKPIAMPEASRSALESLPSARLRWVMQPIGVAEGAGFTGPIARLTDYEDTGGPFFLDREGARPDPIADDAALWIRTDRGLVAIVGCSHAGLINTLRRAQRLGGAPRLHAVLGGFHLAEASEPRLEQTMEALKDLGLELIVPCHCTGDRAVERLRRAFGERVVPGRAGAKFRFGAAPNATEVEKPFRMPEQGSGWTPAR